MSIRKNFHNKELECIYDFLYRRKKIKFRKFTISKLVGGFANDVFFVTENNRRYILKIYSQSKYFYSEYNTFKSSFHFKPLFFDKGKIMDRHSILMEYAGSKINANNFTLDNLLEVIISFHKTKNVNSKIKKYNFNDRQIREVYDNFGKEMLSELEVIFALPFRTDTLIHGDINLSNLRLKDGKIIMIDFDEAGFSDPVFEFAFLFWSDIEVCKKTKKLEELIDSYNKKNEVKVNKKWLHSAIMLAGIHFYLWRKKNLNNNLLIQEARNSVVNYYETIYKKIRHI